MEIEKRRVVSGLLEELKSLELLEVFDFLLKFYGDKVLSVLPLLS